MRKERPVWELPRRRWLRRRKDFSGRNARLCKSRPFLWHVFTCLPQVSIWCGANHAACGHGRTQLERLRGDGHAAKSSFWVSEEQVRGTDHHHPRGRGPESREDVRSEQSLQSESAREIRLASKRLDRGAGGDRADLRVEQEHADRRSGLVSWRGIAILFLFCWDCREHSAQRHDQPPESADGNQLGADHGLPEDHQHQGASAVSSNCCSCVKKKSCQARKYYKVHSQRSLFLTLQADQIARLRPIAPHEHPAGRHGQAGALRAGRLRRRARRVPAGGGVRAHRRVPGGLLEGNKASPQAYSRPTAGLLTRKRQTSMLSICCHHCRTKWQSLVRIFQSFALCQVVRFPFHRFYSFNTSPL